MGNQYYCPVFRAKVICMQLGPESQLHRKWCPTTLFWTLSSATKIYSVFIFLKNKMTYTIKFLYNAKLKVQCIFILFLFHFYFITQYSKYLIWWQPEYIHVPVLCILVCSLVKLFYTTGRENHHWQQLNNILLLSGTKFTIDVPLTFRALQGWRWLKLVVWPIACFVKVLNSDL